MRRIVEQYLRLRWGAAAVVLAITSVCLYGILLLEYDEDPRNLLRSRRAAASGADGLPDGLASEDFLAVVVLRGEDLLQRETLAAMRSLVLELQETEGVVAVDSLFSARGKKRFGAYLLPLIPPPTAEPERFESARREIEEHPYVIGHFLSSDHRVALLVVRLTPDSRELSDLEPILRRIQRVLDDDATRGDLQTTLTGVPMIRMEIIRAMQRDQLVFTFVGTVLAALIAWLIFRRWDVLLTVIVPPLVGVCWVLGGLGLAGVKIDILISIIPPLVMMVGFTASVHLALDMQRSLRDGRNKSEAIVDAMTTLAVPCSLSALTTAIGFGSLAVAEVRSIQMFGLSCAMGTLVNFVAVMTTVPLLAVMRRSVEPIGPIADGKDEFFARWAQGQLDWLQRRRRRLVSVAVALALGMTFLAMQVGTEYRLADTLPTRSATRAVLHELDRDFGGLMQAYVLVEWPPEATIASPSVYRVLNDVHGVLQGHALVRYPLSLHSLVDSLPGSSLARRVSYLRYLGDGVLSRFVAPAQRMTVVTAHLPDAGASRLQPVLDQIDAELQELESRHPGFRLRLAGPSVMMFRSVRLMIEDLWKSLLLASVVILIVMVVTFRSVWLSVLCILPNTFPLLVAASYLYLAGKPLEIGSIMVFTICLGIAVDDTIHLVFRFGRELRVRGNVAEALETSLHRVGQALIVTTLALLAGYGTLLLSQVAVLVTFGILACLAIGAALLGDLLILPALLLCFAPGPRTAREEA